MTRPRAWVCWSSGKDSAWALHVARQERQLDVVGLLTTITAPYGRVSMHGVREEIVEAQARAAGLPWYPARIPASCSLEAYEAAMRAAVEAAKDQGVTEMIFGDLFLEDVRAYREKQLAGSGIAPRFPLWGRPTDRLAAEMIEAHLVAYVTCVDGKRLPQSLAGQRFDRALLAQLPPGTDPARNAASSIRAYAEDPCFPSRSRWPRARP